MSYTRVTRTTQTFIGHCLVRVQHNDIISAVIEVNISDQYAIYSSLSVNDNEGLSQKEKQKQIPSRSLS